MRVFYFICGFILIELFSVGIFAKVDYNETEIAKLHHFLSQQSAEYGKKNYQQIGLESIDDGNWFESVPNLYWNTKTGSVERIYWSNYNLSGHLDFSDFTSLLYLYISFNEIKSINVTNCPILMVIDCYTNDLTEIDISTNPSLTYVRLGYNNVRSVDISHNPNLSFLCCTRNRVESLELLDHERLREVYCVENNMYSLRIENCTALEKISCEMNQYENINVINAPKLKYFACSYCGLKELKFNNCASIEEIKCDNNEISELDFSNCEHLIMLECYRNNLESINLAGCKSLANLKCEDNQLYALNVSSSPILSFLTCKNNNLTLSTLPHPTTLMTTYSYVPQFTVALECKYDNIDLSEFYNIDDNITKYSWYRRNIPVAPVNNNEGVFAFDEKYIGETFRCWVQNSILPLLVLQYDVTFTKEDISSNIQPAFNKHEVYAGEHMIHIKTDRAVSVNIYSLQGTLIMKKKVGTSHTSIPVESGMYVVVIDDITSYKLIVR